MIHGRAATLAYEAARGLAHRRADRTENLLARAIVGREQQVRKEAGRAMQISELVGGEHPLPRRLRSHFQQVLGCCDDYDGHSVFDIHDIAIVQLFAPGQRDDELSIAGGASPEVRPLALFGRQLQPIHGRDGWIELGDIREDG
ncbi:MAG TPA: hypothetical protein VIP11_20520 [Gemmatimonadaceae bacterium]